MPCTRGFGRRHQRRRNGRAALPLQYLHGGRAHHHRPKPYDIHIPLEATVNINQRGAFDAGINNFLPTGNVFSGDGFTFYNDDFNPEINYYYEDGNPAEDPGPLGSTSEGIEAVPINASASCPMPNTPEPPCDPCNELTTGWEDGFYLADSERQIRLANLPNITDSTELQAELDTIRELRLEMNRLAGNLLQFYTPRHQSGAGGLRHGLAGQDGDLFRRYAAGPPLFLHQGFWPL